MADQWYYSQQGQRKGPLSEEQFKQLASSGQLKPTDMVWKSGMDKWIQASKVKGLFASAASNEPPPIAPPSDNGVPNKRINPILAAVANFCCFSCLGYILLGQTKKGLLVLLSVFIGYFLCGIPGLVISVLGMIDAYKIAKAVQDGQQVGENEYKMELLYKIISVLDKSAVFRP